MRILALDCATKTGWALCRDGVIEESGVQEFSLQRGESPGMRFLRFRRWLMNFGATIPDVVVYEQSHHRGGAATELCVGMTTRAQEWAAEIQAESLPVHSGRLKKWATGNGAAGKEQMIEAAAVKTGITILDDNHADAILLALYAWAEVGATR